MFKRISNLFVNKKNEWVLHDNKKKGGNYKITVNGVFVTAVRGRKNAAKRMKNIKKAVDDA